MAFFIFRSKQINKIEIYLKHNIVYFPHTNSTLNIYLYFSVQVQLILAHISQLLQWVQKCECQIIFIASRNSISMAVCGPPNGYSPNCCHYHCLATYRYRYASTYRHTHTHTRIRTYLCGTVCNSLSCQLFLLLLGNQFYINISRWHLVGYFFFACQARHTLSGEPCKVLVVQGWRR